MDDVLEPMTDLDTGIDASEAAAEESSSVEESSESPTTNAPPIDSKPGEITQPAKLIEGGKLSADAKAHLEELTKLNPALAKQFRDALFQGHRLATAIPGGLKEYQTLKQAVEALGGVDKVQETQETLKWFNDLDAKFTAGDPGFIEAMTETPEGQEAFLQLFPQMFTKFGSMNNEGAWALVSKAMVSDFTANRIPLDLERLQDFIGENPKAQEVLKRITDYMNGVNDRAGKPVTPAKKAAEPATNTNDAEKQQIEADRRESWQTLADSSAKSIYASELAILTKDRKLSPDQLDTVEELFHSQMGKLIKNSAEFGSAAQRFFQAKDRQGYLNHVNAFYKAQIPKALAAAMNRIVPGKPGPKPAVNGAKPQVNGATPKPNDGFVHVANRPAGSEMDVDKTTPDMIVAGRMILKDGRKVIWKR